VAAALESMQVGQERDMAIAFEGARTQPKEKMSIAAVRLYAALLHHLKSRRGRTAADAKVACFNWLPTHAFTATLRHERSVIEAITEPGQPQ